MPGVFDSPAALQPQKDAVAKRAARERAQRLADQRADAEVAARIRAAYEERLKERPGATHSDYRPAYPWQHTPTI